MKAPMTFSWSSTEREKQIVLRVSRLAGAQYQIIAFNTLSKNLSRQRLSFGTALP